MHPDSNAFLERLVEMQSPSGFESRVAALYSEYVRPYADAIRSDVMGNVLAVLNEGAPLKILLAGHMDEISFIVHHIDEEGSLYFSPVGGHDSVVAVGQRVWVHG